MTPEEAIAKLEGRPFKRERPLHIAPERVAQEKAAHEQKFVIAPDQPPREPRSQAGLIVFLVLLCLAGGAGSYYFWSQGNDQSDAYQTGFAAGKTAAGMPLTSTPEQIETQSQQIKELQENLAKSNASLQQMQQEMQQAQENLASETQEKERLARNLITAQAVLPSEPETVSPTQEPPAPPADPFVSEAPTPSAGEQSMAEYNKAIEKNPNDVSAYLNRALAHEEERNYDEAIQDLNKAIAIAPGSMQAYTARGIAYQAKGKYAEALADFNRAIKIKPDYSLGFYRRGDIFYLQGRYSAASDNWIRAVRLDSENASSGITYFKRAPHNRIIADNSQVIKVYPEHAQAFFKRGSAYGAKNDHARAIADLSQAIALDPKYAEAYKNRAMAYFFQHDYNEALADVKKAEDLGAAVNADFMNSLKTALGKSG